MPQPTKSEMHVDVPMTNISVMYRNPEYVADRIFQPVPVVKQSDKYFEYRQGPFFRDDADRRAPGTMARRSGYRITTGTYYCDEIALAKEIPDEDRKNADTPLSPDIDATEFCTEQILIRKERLVSAVVRAWSVTEDADGKWAPTGSTNTFIEDVRAGKETIRAAIGRYPNALFVDSKTYNALREVDQILEKIKYTQKGIISADLIAQVIGVDEIIVGSAIYSSDEETSAGSAFTAVDIWEVNAGKGMGFLFYKPPAPGLRIPAAGYVFNWKQRKILRWREEWIHSDVVEASEAFDIKIIASGAGKVFIDTYLT